MEFRLAPEDFRPIVESCVAEVLRQRGDNASVLGDRLWWSEDEVAYMFGLNKHRIRDCRYRGEIVGTRVGRKIGYTREQVFEFLSRQRESN